MTVQNLLSYPGRLQTFEGYWDRHEATARQLAAIGHVYDRPPLETLEEGSRCISCSAFVKRELSTKALGDSPMTSGSYDEDFENFSFHHPSCTRLQVRIPLDPQSIFPGLHGYRLDRIRSKFEKKATSTNVSTPNLRLPQSSSLFSLPTEIRLEIYSMILPNLDRQTEIVPLNRDSARVITSVGYAKTGPRDTTKPNLLRTCWAVNEEAMGMLYSYTTFKFASSKVMYLFLRSIGKAGRRLVKAVDVHCGGREDAIAFALLATCDKLQAITIRLPRPVILFSRAPIWCVDGMSCLLALNGLEDVKFGPCESAVNYMSNDKPDAAVIRRELTRLKHIPADSDIISRYLNA